MLRPASALGNNPESSEPVAVGISEQPNTQDSKLLFVFGGIWIFVGIEVRGDAEESLFRRVAHTRQNLRTSLAKPLFRGLANGVEHGLRMLPQRGGRRQQPRV